MTATALATARERTFSEDEIIVSKTDLKGHITYVNRVFLSVSGYTRDELLGQPHSIIRHPDMPGGVFKLLWDTIAAGQESFAYVKNQAKDGQFYWVLAHVTPSFDARGAIVGYHSNRRSPDRAAVRRIEPVYRQMLTIEAAHSRKSEAAAASVGYLAGALTEAGTSYEEYVWRLTRGEKTGLGND